jgi:hypothetical protein
MVNKPQLAQGKWDRILREGYKGMLSLSRELYDDTKKRLTKKLASGNLHALL